MNLNGSLKLFNRLVLAISQPAQRAALITQSKQDRFNAVKEGRRTLPFFLPVYFLESMYPRQVATAATEKAKFSVVVQGALTPLLGRGTDGNAIRLDGNISRNLTRAGWAATPIPFDALMGRRRTASQEFKGEQDIFYFPTPAELQPGEVLTVDVKCPDDAAAAAAPYTVEGYVTFVGTRIFEDSIANTPTTAKMLEQFKREIDANEAQETRFLRVDVNTATEAGRKNLETQEAPQTLLVLGVYSTFDNVLINLRDGSGEAFSLKPFPINALAAWSETPSADSPYKMFPRPFVLPKGGKLSMDISIDYAAYEGDGFTGKIVFLCKTI